MTNYRLEKQDAAIWPITDWKSRMQQYGQLPIGKTECSNMANYRLEKQDAHQAKKQNIYENDPE